MQAEPRSESETAFRAFCLGVVAMVITPMLAFPAVFHFLQATGRCELPVFCGFDASNIALPMAVPGFVFGAVVSVMLDRRAR